MARDEQTLPLLEVSQQQKQKYQEQAKKCTVPFLYKALKIMNQCDINYRQSNNKRLLVELTLIQIAQITQPDDDTSAGLSPKRLKSLFKKLTSTTLSKPAVQVAGTESIPVTRSRTKQQQEKEDVAPRKEIKIDTTPQPSNAPKLKLTSLMTTFGSLKNNEQKPVEQEETPTVSQEEQNKFSDEDLQLQWMMMCNRMPESMVGMASRMKNLIPRITNYPNVEVVVDNQILLTQLQGIKSRIKATLARDLHNGNLQVEIRLAEGKEFKKALTKREVFDEIRKHNPAIEKLRMLMELELI
jgi:DNA polymerase-3 subunit gamma/tau